MKTILLLLISFTCLAQGKTHLVKLSNGQYLTQYMPNDSLTGKHPVIICANGVGETGTFNSATSSIGYYCKSINGLPAFWNATYSRYSTFIVIEVYKPTGDITGAFQPERFVDGLNYALTIPGIDPTQIYVTGLSLSGGGVWALLQKDSSILNKIAAVAPITGTQDAVDGALNIGITNSGIPFTAYECLDDENRSTAGATQHYEAAGRWSGMPNILKYGRFIYPSTGGHYGAWLKAYDTTHQVYTAQTVINGVTLTSNYTNNPNLYEWFLTKSRPKAAPPVVIVIPPIVVTKKLIAIIQVMKDDGITVLTTTNVYDDGSVIKQ